MTEDSAYLFQSQKDRCVLFVAVCADLELAHLRAQQSCGPDVEYFGRFYTLEQQARLYGGKMTLRPLGVKA